MEIKELHPDDLYQPCNPDDFSFETTADLEDLPDVLGQPRAVEALAFGIGIKRDGYNIFAVGESRTGKHALVRQFLETRAADEEVPGDLCYVNNFEESHKPRTLSLPPGKGRRFSEDMRKLVDEAGNTIQAAFENEEYHNRRQVLVQEFQERQQNAFVTIKKQAEDQGFALVRTPAGVVFAQAREGEVVPPEEIKKWPEEERERMEKQAAELQEEAQKVFQKIPKWQREGQEKLKELNREVTRYAVGPLLEEMRNTYKDLPDVLAYLKAVESDAVENVLTLLMPEGAQQQGASASRESPSPPPPSVDAKEPPFIRRYMVNVVVDRGASKGAPVVYEDNPTYLNLVGRVEHIAQMGALLTDFNMIRAGALHRANGGYLILEATKVLTQPHAWDGLKRMLRARKIRIESLGQIQSQISTVTLDPEPVPLDVKVTLLGPPFLYYLLRENDPEFSELFKVTADFDSQMDRTEDSQVAYARLIGMVARREGLRPFDRGAVVRLIEHSARLVGDKEKLSVQMDRVTDLLRESDYWAAQNGDDVVSGADVQKAIDAWTYRSDRIRERMHEAIQRGTLFIDTEGSKVGQVNGLAVFQPGEFKFGQPSRITARVRLGKGEVVDIEREVEMGGPLHSKGVLILSGFLGARYALERPLSLSASLVFEQSYGGVDGDSASSAELYALLSAISEIPIGQSLAVTGSVNQHGQVQPIGGANEKIEGFFDICKARGLTGEQGVLIPASNVRHLMLREDVIDTVREGKFHIYPVETIDQGITILTGVAAGERDEAGNYPGNSVNGKVLAKLTLLAEKRVKYDGRRSEG